MKLIFSLVPIEYDPLTDSFGKVIDTLAATTSSVLQMNTVHDRAF